jgi:hypothetical protein
MVMVFIIAIRSYAVLLIVIRITRDAGHRPDDFDVVIAGDLSLLLFKRRGLRASLGWSCLYCVIAILHTALPAKLCCLFYSLGETKKKKGEKKKKKK